MPYTCFPPPYIVPVFPLSHVGLLSLVLSSLFFLCLVAVPACLCNYCRPEFLFGTFCLTEKRVVVIYMEFCPVPLRMSSCPSLPVTEQSIHSELSRDTEQGVTHVLFHKSFPLLKEDSA